MQINLRSLKSMSIWTTAILSFAWILMIVYILLNNVTTQLTATMIKDISLVVIIVFAIFFAAGIVSSVIISIILSRKSQYAFINIVPIFLCIPAILSCNKYILEWKNKSTTSSDTVSTKTDTSLELDIPPVEKQPQENKIDTAAKQPKNCKYWKSVMKKYWQWIKIR